MAIDGEEALSWLVQRFPELEEPFASERASHPEINLHVMWDIMFRVVFEPMMAADPPDPSGLESFFEWMEDVLLRGDKQVMNWVDTGILERFGDELRWVRRSRPYMGPMTIKHHRMVQAWWGRDDGFADLGPPGPPPFTGFHIWPRNR